MSDFFINIEQKVIDAYKEHGLRARPNSVVVLNGACCALGALTGGRAVTTSDAGYKLGLPWDATNCFVGGFDRALYNGSGEGSEMYTLDPDAFDAGYRTGKAVMAAGLYLPRAIDDGEDDE